MRVGNKTLSLCSYARCTCFSPNIQTSLAVVKRLKLMDSGAIHLIGNRLIEAARRRDKTQEAETVLEVNFPPEAARSGTATRHRTFIILLLVYVARQAEVAELDAFGRSHQHISHGDISAAGRQNRQQSGAER